MSDLIMYKYTIIERNGKNQRHIPDKLLRCPEFFKPEDTVIIREFESDTIEERTYRILETIDPLKDKRIGIVIVEVVGGTTC